MTIRLLVADDHSWILEGLRHAFRRTEIEIVFEARTAAEAVRFAREQAIDAVLLDLGMPGGGGIEALKQIKAVKQKLPVLVYSADSRAHTIQGCRALGADGYVRKGVESQVLVDAVRRAVCRYAREDRQQRATTDVEPSNGV